ncbi:MAG: ribosome-associated translation inhibitor RaiA [Betaproteobacteria bacterium]|nr:ribosome-associated translation inhibitor RaiA [Betaproteobacteria bacterium]
MNLHLNGNHLEITSAMRDYITGKLDRITRHFDHVIDVSVILSVEKLEQKAEANVHLSGKNIFVESHGSDMYAAIDALVDKLDRQIIRHKERNFEHRGGRI